MNQSAQSQSALAPAMSGAAAALEEGPYLWGLLYMSDLFGDGWAGNYYRLVEQDGPQPAELGLSAWFNPRGHFSPPNGGQLRPQAEAVAAGTLPEIEGFGPAIVDLSGALRERASYVLAVDGGEYKSEVVWQLGSLGGGAPSRTCFTILGNRTFVTWDCPPNIRQIIDATATPSPTPLKCGGNKPIEIVYKKPGAEGMNAIEIAILSTCLTLCCCITCCLLCNHFQDQLIDQAFGLYNKGSKYKRRFRAMQAARAARATSSSTTVIVVGRDHKLRSRRTVAGRTRRRRAVAAELASGFASPCRCTGGITRISRTVAL